MNITTIPPELAQLSVRDIIVLMYITALGIAPLRWSVESVSDLALLRAELIRREWAVS